MWSVLTYGEFKGVIGWPSSQVGGSPRMVFLPTEISLLVCSTEFKVAIRGLLANCTSTYVNTEPSWVELTLSYKNQGVPGRAQTIPLPHSGKSSESPPELDSSQGTSIHGCHGGGRGSLGSAFVGTIWGHLGRTEALPITVEQIW